MKYCTEPNTNHRSSIKTSFARKATNMKKHLAQQITFATMVITIMATSAAQSNASQTSPQQQGLVGLGGETLFVFKSDSDLNKDIKTRVNDSHDRLRFILNNPNLKSKDILVKPLGNYGAKITANGQLIVPIGVSEASAHGSTPMQLAKDWAFHLRQVLPKLTARPDLFARSYSLLSKRSLTRR